jgi:hypothetical protein
MTLALHRAARALAATILVGATVGAALLFTGSGAQGTTTPPWEPDPNSVGGLVFYNSAGTAITGGNLTDAPIAAYIQGTHGIRGGDTKATLYGYLPKVGIAPGAWSGELLGGPSVYPNAGAPTPLAGSALPLETGAGIDLSVGDLASDFPNTDTTNDGYAGLYQLRLLTTQAGQPANTKYDSADILITGSTWSVFYSPGPVTKTTTSLSVSPTTADHGRRVSLSATVSPTAATGSVQFFSGTVLLKAVTVASGKAAYSSTGFGDGVHQLKAVFVPSSSAYSGSHSSTHSVTIERRVTAVTLRSSHTSLTRGHAVVLSIRETPAARGDVRIYNGSHRLRTLRLSDGRVTYTTAKLRVGTYSFKAEFIPTSPDDFARSTSKAVTVRVRS